MKAKITLSGLVSNNRKIRLGIAGCGKIFERLYLPALIRSDELELAGVCDISQERRDWVRSLIHEISVYDSIEPLLDGILLDAMVIATPPDTHCELTLKALGRGLHVLVEKPMALNLEDAIAMVESSDSSGRHLRVGFNRRFRRPYMNVRDKLARVPPKGIRSIFFEFVFSRRDWNPVTPYLGDDGRGGGALDDVASHLVDVLPWVTGAKISEVKAKPVSGRRGEFLVNIVMKLENGVTAEGIVGHGTRYSEQLEIQMDNRRLLVFPVGMIETRRMPESLLSLYCSLSSHLHFSWQKLFPTLNMTQASMADQLLDFARAIRGETHSIHGADGMNGVDAFRVTSACRESIRSGGVWISIVGSGRNRS